MNAPSRIFLGFITFVLLVAFAPANAQTLSHKNSAITLGGFNSPDTASPHVDTTRNCYSGFVHVTDSGLEPNGIDTESGIKIIELDSIYNMDYLPDSPGFIEGSDVDTTGYGWEPVDNTKPGILIVSIFDQAGNETTVTTTYVPFGASMEPQSQDVGEWFLNQPKIAFDTIYNFGAIPFPINEIALKYGDRGFSIHDSAGGPLDLSEIPAGGHRVIEIEFQPSMIAISTDTLIFTGLCTEENIVLAGAGVMSDWSVDSAIWTNIPFPTVPVSEPVVVHNNMTIPIRISGAIADSAEFTVDANQFPLVVPAMSAASFNVAYAPMFNGEKFTSLLHVQADEAGSHDTKLTATASTASVSSQNSESSAVMLENFDGTIQPILPQCWTEPIRIEIFNALGRVVFRANIMGVAPFDVGVLPRGIYFYRITSGTLHQTGKLILGQ